MAVNVYNADALTGGSNTSLDGIDGSILFSGDFCVTLTSTYTYVHRLNATSGAAESSPDVIAPDLNAGTKRWILIKQYISNVDHGELAGLTDDDHTIYLLANGSRELTANWNFGSYTVSGSVVQPNMIDFPEISTPASPDTDKIRIYAVEDADFTVLETITDLGIVNRINQDTFRVARNTSGATISGGSAVYYTGSTGNKPNFSMAQANAEATMPAIGMTTSDVANNAFGEVMIIGRLTGIKTDYAGWAEGDILYVDSATPGVLTKTRPTHPNLAQWMATIEVVHANNGVLLVKTQALTGIEDGTNRNSYTIGDTSSGTKSLSMDGTANSSLDWDSDNSTWSFSSGDLLGYISDAEMATISGDIVAQIPSDYYTQAEVTTISGDIVAQIPAAYTDEEAQDAVGTIMSGTGSVTVTYDDGTPLITISGSDIGVTDHSALNNLDYASAGHTGFASSDQLATTSGDIVTQIVTDHGGLSGLSDDDHTIYVLHTHGTGSYNFVAGNNAGSSLIAGASSNILIGEDAGASITESDFNICIGRLAGNGLLGNDHNNIMIGYSAGEKSIGSDNVYIGNDTASDVAGNGAGNIIVGGGASPDLSSADSNVILGWNSAGLLTTGDNNVIVGAAAGARISTGELNVIIGKNAGPTTNQSNKLYIHNTESDTPLIYGDFSTGTVTINTILSMATGTSINEFSTDGTMAGNSDDAIPTEQAVKTYVDTEIATISGNLDDHSELNGLDYASAGHTGFQPAGDYATNTQLATTSGDIVAQIPTDYYTQAEVDGKWATWSGTIDHDTINNYTIDEHRTIDDNGTGSTDLWSAEKILAKMSTLSGTFDEHNELLGLDADDHQHYSLADGTRAFTGTVSGVTPTADAHLATKAYVDGTYVTVVRGSHNFSIDDNTDTVPFDVAMPDTSYTIVATMKNVDDGTPALYDFVITDVTTSGFDVVLMGDTDSQNYYLEYLAISSGTVNVLDAHNHDHHNLLGVTDDDHLMYVRTNGIRGFTATVSGVTPTEDYHLVTKAYADTVSGGAGVTDHGALTGLDDNDHGNIYHTQAEITTISGDIVAQIGSGGGELVFDDISTTTLVAGTGAGAALQAGAVDNVIIGNSAGAALTTGDGNVLIGKDAGKTMTGTSDSVVIGEGAARNQSVSNSVCIGYQAAQNNQNGVYQVWIGYNCGNSSDGNYSVIIGAAAGTNADNDNVIIGYDAGDGASVNDGNVIIGREAGQSCIDYNVMIGYKAGENETGSNKLYIENSNSATPLIYGDFSTDEVRINGRLEVDEDIELNPSPGADHEYSGITAEMTVDVNTVGIGGALHLDTDGNWVDANATATSSMPCQAMACETGTGTKIIMHQGYFRDDSWTWTVGNNVYVDESNGALTQTAPTTSGSIVQIVGYATHADRMYFQPQLYTITLG